MKPVSGSKAQQVISSKVRNYTSKSGKSLVEETKKGEGKKPSISGQIRRIRNSGLEPTQKPKLNAMGAKEKYASGMKWANEYLRWSKGQQKSLQSQAQVPPHLNQKIASIIDLLDLQQNTPPESKSAQASERLSDPNPSLSVNTDPSNTPLESNPSTKANLFGVRTKNVLQKLSFLVKPQPYGTRFNTNSILFTKSFQEVSDRYNTVIALRVPSGLGQRHLSAGFPTKNLHVKAKSSVAGPTAGFIAADAQLSKRPKSEVEKQQSAINDALEKGAKRVDLNLSKQQVKFLVDNQHMNDLGENRYQATYSHGSVEFNIDQETGHVTYAATGLPVQVLTNPPEVNNPSNDTEKAITADYDLFAIIPRKNQSDNLRPMKVGAKAIRFAKPESKEETQSSYLKEYDNLGGKQAFSNALKAFTDAKGHEDDLDKDKGNFHTFGVTIINAINREVQAEGYEGGKLVWHGDEMGNPYSDGFNSDDSPIFFIPHQGPIQVHNKEELAKLYDYLREQGYAPEFSPRFGV